MNSLSLYLQNIRAFFAHLLTPLLKSGSKEEQINQPPPDQTPPKYPKIFLPILIALAVIFLLVLSLGIFLQTSSKPKPLTPPEIVPSTMPTPTEAPPPSRWATDSGVLIIEKDIKSISNELENVNLRGQELLPPTLDNKVEF